MIDLFPDQIDLLNQARNKVRDGCKSLLIQAATGAGKTYLAADIVLGAYNKGKTVHFVVPRRDLITSTSGTLKSFNIPHGFIASGIPTYHKYKIFVCSSSTLVNRLDSAPDLAIIDETHYGSTGLDKIINYYKSKGTVIIGLSATPWKLSGQGLKCWYDEMVCGPSIRWLIDNKRLADYRAFAPDRIDLSRIKISAGDYAKGQLSDRMENDRVLIGNAVKHYKNHGYGKLGATFGVSIKHSHMLAQEYRDNGVPAMHIDGDTPDDERKSIAKAFAKRELLQLCNCDLLTFGYDLSAVSGMKGINIQCLTDCKPTKSLSAQMQKNGRNFRYDGDIHLFFDHANNFSEHGLPCEDRNWTLEDRKKGSGSGGEREREINVRQCPKCFYCHKPSSICPNCQHVYEVQSRELEQIDADLVEIEKQSAKKQARMEVGMAKTLDDLKRIQKERGYNPYWVKHMAKVKGIKK